MKKIEAVVTIGLQNDESGFLEWYKQHNTKGIIVAVNLKSPPYVGDKDFILHEDAQIVVPALLKSLQ